MGNLLSTAGAQKYLGVEGQVLSCHLCAVSCHLCAVSKPCFVSNFLVYTDHIWSMIYVTSALPASTLVALVTMMFWSNSYLLGL